MIFLYTQIKRLYALLTPNNYDPVPPQLPNDEIRVRYEMAEHRRIVTDQFAYEYLCHSRADAARISS